MLEIRIYGDPILRQKTQDVTVFDESLRKLAEEMAATMREAEGLGLSANQVGRSVNMFVLDWEALGKPLGWQAFVNPQILEAQNERLLDEGCLSFPGIRDKVKRFEKVRLRAQDLEGKPFEVEGEGLLAEAFQHETDHLAGVVFIDRMPTGARELLRKELRDLAKKVERARTKEAD